MSFDLAVLIVTWNVADLIQDALQSLIDDLQATALSWRIVVVDSASSDDTVSVVRGRFPQVEVIASDENLGFGRANNAGLQVLGFGADVLPETLPRAVYFLNPDTITTAGATKTLYDTVLADEQTGVVGARLTYGDGSHQHSAFAFPDLRQLWVEFFPTPGRLIDGAFNGRYPRGAYEGERAFKVDCVLGATMMVRRAVILATGGFDPAFFMYGEEIDWQWRIQQAGFRVLCAPSAHVVHLSGKSTSQVRPRSLINLWESRLKLFDRHYPAWKRALARRMIAFGMRRKITQARQAGESADIIEAYRIVRKMATT